MKTSANIIAQIHAIVANYYSSVKQNPNPSTSPETQESIFLREIINLLESDDAVAIAAAEIAEHPFVIALDALQIAAHANSRAKGFWQDHDDINAMLRGSPLQIQYQRFWKMSRIGLMHSELSEGLEGIRKDKPDDHLPQYSMEACELADVVIRAMDYAGAYHIPLAEIILAKMDYNAQRPYMHGKKA